MSRVIPGLILAACWLLLLLSNHFLLFRFVVVLIAFLAGQEYLKMALKKDLQENSTVVPAAVIALPVAVTGLWGEPGLGAGLFFSFFLSTCYVLARYSLLNDAFAFLARHLFGIFYIGFLLAHLLLLWSLPEGNMWLIILVAVTAGSDSGAYYCGRIFGKNKLCRNVSPKKTIEGAIGGLFCGVAMALFFAWVLLGSFNWMVLVFVAVLLTGVGIIGDLCESIIKRGTQTKDSGKILLGHGGILDRIDSLLLAAPLLYYLLLLTG